MLTVGLGGLIALGRILSKTDRFTIGFLKLVKLNDEIEALQLDRRKLFPVFCADADTWDEFRLNNEIRQRRRDLAEISSLATDPPDQDPSTPSSPNPFKSQERFLQELIDYLEARLKKLSNAPPPSPPPPPAPPTKAQRQAAKLAEIAQLQKDRQAALATTNDPNLQAQFNNMFDDAQQRLLDEYRKLI